MKKSPAQKLKEKEEYYISCLICPEEYKLYTVEELNNHITSQAHIDNRG